jgi:CheY-like chemotaxis protein
MPDAEDVGQPGTLRQTIISMAPHILIADGDADTRSLYRQALGHLATIDEAADGADALAKALRQPPTLVITEIRLPHLDGYALCTALRAQGTTCDTKILVVTACGFETPAGRAAQAGADDVLVKPCAIDRLRARVDRLLAERGARGVRRQTLPHTTHVAIGARAAGDDSPAVCERPTGGDPAAPSIGYPSPSPTRIGVRAEIGGGQDARDGHYRDGPESAPARRRRGRGRTRGTGVSTGTRV